MNVDFAGLDLVHLSDSILINEFLYANKEGSIPLQKFLIRHALDIRKKSSQYPGSSVRRHLPSFHLVTSLLPARVLMLRIWMQEIQKAALNMNDFLHC